MLVPVFRNVALYVSKLGLRVEKPMIRIRFPVAAKYFSLFHRVQIDPWDPSASYPVAIMGSFSGSKGAFCDLVPESRNIEVRIDVHC
jgi:hypothetical protein